jgi:hypothetical protein
MGICVNAAPPPQHHYFCSNRSYIFLGVGTGLIYSFTHLPIYIDLWSYTAVCGLRSAVIFLDS